MEIEDYPESLATLELSRAGFRAIPGSLRYGLRGMGVAEAPPAWIQTNTWTN